MPRRSELPIVKHEEAANSVDLFETGGVPWRFRLQGDPSVGTPGVISADTPTNIFFFIAGLRPDGE